MRVLPDVSGLDKAFDYLVPTQSADAIGLGSLVRVDLHGRRVAGWVIALDVEPPPGVTLRELRAVSSVGPSAEVLDLARWAAHRWHGRLAAILRSASPDRMVPSLGPLVTGPQRLRSAVMPTELGAWATEALERGGVTVIRVPPDTDRYPLFEALAGVGNGIIVTAEVAEARHLGGRFRRNGGRVALAGRDWAAAAAGSVVTGARTAVWATVAEPVGVIVIDEHDDRLQEERNPTWHARDVAVERARRLGVPCILVSSAPSVAALELADIVMAPSRRAEREGWPIVTVVDRRQDDPPTPGLFSSAVVAAVRGPGRVLCVLNRKGRARLLACGVCGELVRTVDGEHLMAEIDGELVAATGERRPKVCAACGGTSLKRLRLGVDRVREELEALAGEPVGEITAETPPAEIEQHRVVVGTEALLHRINRADVIVFLDFDQELLAPRYRAAEQAMALLVLAARVVGPRRTGRAGQADVGGRIVVQTRVPGHRVLVAVVRADPGRCADAERSLRRETLMPPFTALAEISGPGAAELLEPLTAGAVVGADVMGPRPDGRYLLRAPDADGLAEVLSRLPRPKGRVRVAVDPPRA